MNLLALRRRHPRKKKREKTSPEQKRRRLGVAGDPPPPPGSSDRLLMAVCSGDADDIRKTLDEARCYVTPEILNCACATGNVLSVTILLEHAGALAVNSTDGRGEAPVHSAVRRGSTDIIRTLMDASADINAQTKYERKTPLHLATAMRKLDVLRFLLSNSATDVNRTDIYGSTPLHVASEVGFSNGADALLQSNASPDVSDRNGWTPLHVAAANGQASIAEQLMGAEADVDRQNQFGRTALHWACSAGHTAIVRLLLRHGASVDIDDRHGKRAADHAATEEIRRLVDASAEVVRFSVLSHLDSGGGMIYSTAKAQLRRSETTVEEESLLKRPLRSSGHCSADESRETGRPRCDLDDSSSSSSLDPGVWPSDWSLGGTRLQQRTSDKWSSTEKDPNIWCSGERPDDAQAKTFPGYSAIGRTRETGPVDIRRRVHWPDRIRRPSSDGRHGSPSTGPRTKEEEEEEEEGEEEEEEEEEEEDSPAPGGSLEAIFERKNVTSNDSTSKRTQVIRERPSKTKSSSEDDFKRTSAVEFNEKSPEVSQLEDSGFDDKGSEQRLKPRSHGAEGKDLDSHNATTTTTTSIHRVNVIMRSKNTTDDNDDDDDDDDEKLSRNVKSVLDRMSFPSDNETTLDDLVQRFRNSSTAYIDSFSNSLKHLMQNIETTKK